MEAQRQADLRVWHQNPRFGVALIVAASFITVLVGFMGPSATTVPLGIRSSLLPPWYLPSGIVRLPDAVSVGALWFAVLGGATGLVLALRAVNAGWRPRPWRLIGIGGLLTLATSLVPPLTSADVLMYAAYGRLQVIGKDPYKITPAEIFRGQFDPVLSVVERPWHDTPSVYGPIASFSQRLANILGGESMHDIVFWLQLFGTTAFLAMSAVAIYVAWPDPAKRTRAILFTICNPIMIWAVIAGYHNEALAVFPALLALALVRKHPFFAGVAMGVAGCVKVSLVFYGLGIVWAYRRNPRNIAWFALGAALPMSVCYLWWQPQALFAAARNTGYASSGSWLMPLWEFAARSPWPGGMRTMLSILAYGLLALMVYALHRVLPNDVVPGAHVTDRRDDVLTTATRASIILSVAWLVTSPYTLSWYDLMVWAPLAWLAGSHFEWALMWRSMWLSLAFVVGRAIEFVPWIHSGGRVIFLVSSYAQLALIFFLLWWALFAGDRNVKFHWFGGVDGWPRRRRADPGPPLPGEGSAVTRVDASPSTRPE